ncbi:hypothetical protein [Pseudomonas aeruginosa]|uniref:hypothetical protein n=1 Tax=Pseudomonas aeruginosa TaxID=287 RepID=UPI0034E06DF1
MSTSSDRDRGRKLIRIYSLALDKAIWDAVAVVLLIAGTFNLFTHGYSTAVCIGLIAAALCMLFASYQFTRKATAFLDQEADMNAYPDQCPPENEVTLLTLGMDEHGHKLRLLVDGRQKWVRVGFKDVASMMRGQELMERLRQRDAQRDGTPRNEP